MNAHEPLDSHRTAKDETAPADQELVSALVTLHELVVGGLDAGAAFGEQEACACGEALGRIAALAEEAQHLGLADIAVRLGEHVTATADGDEARERLAHFVLAAADYVAAPGSPATQQALLACVGDAGVLAEGERDILQLMLGMAPGGSEPPLPEAIPSLPEQLVDSALLAGLQREAGPVIEALAQVAETDGDAEREQMIAAATVELDGLARGAEFSGLAGMAALLHWVARGVENGTVDGAALRAFLPPLADYLQDPTQPDYAARLAALFPAAPAAITGILGEVMVVQSAPQHPARAVAARPEDVSLELPAEINQELLDGLLLELPVQTAAFAQAVQHIVEARANRDDLEVAKRAAHTLKGAANTVGVRGIASLTHSLEDILVALSENGVLPNLGLAQTLSYAADCLEAMSESLAGAGAPPADALDVLQDVLNWANRIDVQGIDVARGVEAEEAAVAEATSVQREAPHEPATMLRVPARLIDELLRLVGETMTSSAQIQNRLALAMGQARAINRQNALLQQLVAELETMVDLRGVGVAGKSNGDAAATEFDALEFEHYNELQTLSRRLNEVATDAREMGLTAEEHLASLTELQEEQARFQLESQRAVMGTRMVPVSSVFSRLQRGVRQACRILDKEAELVLRGESTVMDGQVLQELIDALMHLLRNAVDHGIEAAADRRAAGKPATGRIELEFRREGDYVVVRCSDDGQGLDLDAIRAHAEARGIIAPDVALADDELARLILIPGFSTREEATQVSGRGIGMDAVNTRVLALKGMLQLASRRGAGLMVEMKLPVTLLSTQALLARVRNKTIALSTRGIEDIHYVAAEEPEAVAAGLEALTGERHEVVALEALLDLPGDRRTRGRFGWPVVMVRLESGGRRAVMVQEILESRGLVVKPLGPWVPKIRGIIGATILGDGGVAPVIDLPERLHTPVHVEAPSRPEPTGSEAAEPFRYRVLVVDDSISARRALVQVVRDAGFDVRTAADGLEAIGIVEQRVPDLIITDMEMPRMNGFELAQHMRARAATRHVPVIMITSRSTEKHRRQAELAGVNVYLTKPFNDRELLDHVTELAGSVAGAAGALPA